MRYTKTIVMSLNNQRPIKQKGGVNPIVLFLVLSTLDRRFLADSRFTLRCLAERHFAQYRLIPPTTTLRQSRHSLVTDCNGSESLA